MSTEVNTQAALTEAVQALRALREEVARLADRVATLEAAAPAERAAEPAAHPKPPAEAQAAESQPPTQAAQPPAEPEAEAEVSEELLLVISAAIAAFLGKKPYIRQIRLVTSPTWSQVGRVSIQASHALVHHRSGASL